jgi:ribosomal protein S18 acetylase RimI-like enzyme
MGLLILPSSSSDLAALKEALESCRAFNLEEIAVALEILDSAIAGGPDGDYASFTAHQNHHPAGYICVGQTPLTESTWHLYWLVVHPHFQRQGLATALLSHAEAFVRSRLGRRLILETSGRPDYQGSRRFYQNAGYTHVAQIPDYYRDGDDGVIMYKQLS